MIEILVPALLLLAAIGLRYAYQRRPGQDGTPPGPMGVPLLGYLPFLGTYPWQTLQKMQDKYPKIIAFDMGRLYTVVLQDWEAIKAVLIDQEEMCTGRPQDYVEGLRYFSLGKDGKTHGLIMLEGPKWKATHAFCKTAFVRLGLHEEQMDNIILAHAGQIAKNFRNHNGVFDPETYIHPGMVNILTQVMRGRPLEDWEYKDLFAHAEKSFEQLAVGIVNQYPQLRFVPGPTKNGWDAIAYMVEHQWAFWEKEVTDHEATFSRTDTRDFIDTYLHHQNKHDNKHQSAMQNKDDVITSIMACWSAGPEATSVALLWVVYYLCRHPDIQKRVHDEIDSAIGRSRSITTDDRDILPYTRAVLYESLRLGANAPLAVPRRNLEEIHALGYRIPKHTQILQNVWAVHRNAKYFPDPETFRAERFLVDGKFKLPEQFIIFSFGIRHCPGMDLAQSMLFLTFANLMQHVEFRTAPGTSLPSDKEARLGISCRPLNYKITASARR